MPMVWAEVYAGGIGGFVARLRPNIEPPPHAARRQYLAWCQKQNVPWRREDADYGSRGAGMPPAVADDGDVGVIAAHASRMAVDALLRPETSLFPHPAYVIGLQRGLDLRRAVRYPADRFRGGGIVGARRRRRNGPRKLWTAFCRFSSVATMRIELAPDIETRIRSASARGGPARNRRHALCRAIGAGKISRHRHFA